MTRSALGIGVLVIAVMLSACTGGRESEIAPPVTPQDKTLSCSGLKAEIADSHYIIYQAKKNRGLRAGNILWPFGYGATFISASEAIQSANERMAYLQNVYAIKGCDSKHKSFLPTK